MLSGSQKMESLKNTGNHKTLNKEFKGPRVSKKEAVEVIE
jgi:hypothetical protein